MDLITVDFETFYSREYSLSKLTTEEYIRDPNFSVIGVATKLNDEPTQWVTGDAATVIAHLRALPWHNAMLLSQNTMFDGAILSWRCGIKPKALADTMLMSRALFGTEVSHSLKAISERYGIGQKGDEVLHALGKRRQDFTDEELARYGAYCVNDVQLTYDIFQRMLADGFPLGELRLIDLTLRMFTDPMLELDGAHLRKHLANVRARKQALLDDAGIVDKKDLMSNPKFAGMLRALGVEPPMKISPTTGKETYAFAKTDEAFKALEEHEDDRVQTLVAARLGNKSTLEETRTERFIEIAKRGNLPVPIRYYAAHTGRWGGSDKINLQNLPSRGANAKQIKQSIVAPTGYVLIDADSAQIEARVLAWLAEQEDVVATFAANGDVYKRMASKIFNIDEAEVTKEQRQIGKVVILGAGYGVGHHKLQLFLKMQAGVDVDLTEAKRIIDIYRESNHKISGLWKDAQDMLRYLASGQSVQFGRPGVLTVNAEEGGIRLPSGLYIRYPNLKMDRTDAGTEYHYKVRSGRNYIYGGKCLAGDTDVLTDKGWIPLQKVTRAHRVWDGGQWVNHDGLIYQGKKVTTVVNGVRMTPDHNVLTDRGWRCASSSEGLHRAGFWLPDGTEVSGDKRAAFGVGLPMQLRDGGFARGGGHGKACPPWGAPILWMQGWGRKHLARYVEASRVLGMAVNAGSLPLAVSPSMAQLRGTGYQSMPGVGTVLRSVLGRHGADVPAGADTRPHGQQRRLHPEKLPVGDSESAGGKPTGRTTGGHNKSTQDDGYFHLDPAVSVAPEAVYDLLNAGPNSRFVVRGSTGPFIVHNCVENVTQALARCIVGEQMLKIAEKYRVVLTVHDSVVCCVRQEEAEDAQQYIERCMRWTPDWAEGLPVNCESDIGQRYGE